MSNVLTDLSAALAQTVADAGAGVVRVEGRRRIPATGIVWSADGTILTAHHVVSRDEGIQIGLPDGRSVAATLVGRDPSTDLAVLKAEAADLTPFTEANKQDVAVGHFVLALGRPGKTVQATLGIISALGDGWRTMRGGQIDRYLQTDVVMYPGFSGGPLVNASGHLVGLNTSHLAQGVSLTIPTSTLARVADSLLAHGRVKRGYLGVSTQRARLPENLRGELGQKSGLMIVSVEADSPAENGGLTMGDTILAVADTAVHHHEDLLSQLTGDRVGTAVPIKILRGGKVQTLDVTIGER
ncbi:MAG: trypsin-like peptidase domain-containing protein [Ardenticatenaceae bacterium]|nr:trypsin-like peptidase domain-containing protein [Ardenticatenaceae bacterium]